MASNIYLIRKNGNPRSVQYTQVENVYLSGLRTAHAAVSGNAGTGVVTITGSTIADGMQIIFTSLTGGSGVSIGVAYFAVSSSGETCQLATTEGGSAIALGTNITAGSVIVVAQQMRVWSGEYRDIFDTTNGPLQQSGSYNNYSSGGTPTTFHASTAVTNAAGIALLPQNPVTVEKTGNEGGSSAAYTGLFESVAGFSVSLSDELAHSPLRQTFVNRSFWVFDLGSSHQPRYLYAEYQPGDVIANNAPSSY